MSDMHGAPPIDTDVSGKWPLAARLVSAEKLGDQYLTLRLKVPDQLRFAAGQHLRVGMHDEQGVFERYYSIASCPEVLPEIELCAQLLADGRAHNYWEARHPGDIIQVAEPAGTFILPNSVAGQKILFVAGGSGIAPLRSMLGELFASAEPRTKVSLIYGCRSSLAMPYLDDLRRLAKKYQPVLMTMFRSEREVSLSVSDVKQGTVATALAEYFQVNSSQFTQIYMCGPPAMLSFCRKELMALGIDGDQLFVESYSAK